MRNNRLVSLRRPTFLALSAAAVALLLPAASASAQEEEVLGAASYPNMTTYSCRTNAINMYPGQNINDFGISKTCPNAAVVSGPGSTAVFQDGGTDEGYITRFKPSMVEVHPDGSTTTPPVWDLHLHHVVWLDEGPVFAAGEEKTIAKMPQGYGYLVDGDQNWGINQMLHSLNASEGRQVYITWEIDWVPAPDPSIKDLNIRWLDVAGSPQIYPVFDAERGFDINGDGLYTFPEEVPTDPAMPGYEERENISTERSWTVPAGGRNLIFGAGHLHPGGLYVDLNVARDGADAGSVDGDDPTEVRQLFRSDAKYYEPAGAVSWDVSMEATRPSWRISLKGGDTVYINATYDVRKASWYESMGILPLAVSNAADAAAADPFDDAAEFNAMIGEGGVVTHGHLTENADKKARNNLKLPDPRKLRTKGKKVPAGGIDIESFVYSKGGYSATRKFPTRLMRPPAIKPGSSVTFNNLDALPGTANSEQVWHSITSCKAPCNKGSGIGYPLAAGPIKFDSGQLGFGNLISSEVTTQTSSYTTPPLTKPGKTYTYFCRIHPFMRGSIRVRGGKPKEQ